MRLWNIIIVIIVLGYLVPGRASQPALESARARQEFARGLAALNSGQLADAKTAFTEAVNQAPQWGLAYLHLGLTQQALEPKSKVALELFRQAAEFEPGNARIHYHLGIAYYGQGQINEAIRELKTTLVLRPKMTEAHFQLATILQAQTRAAEAVLVLKQLLDLEPGHTGAWSSLAEIYEEQNKLTEAEEALINLTNAQPNIVYNFFRLGQFYQRHGETDKAKQAFRRASNLKPQPQRKMRKLR